MTRPPDVHTRTVLALALLAALDLGLALPLIGATPRPFHWMNLAPGPVYAMVSVRRVGAQATLTASVTPGGLYALQRNTNDLAPSGWTDVVVLSATSNTITAVDPAATAARAAYRVRSW